MIAAADGNRLRELLHIIKANQLLTVTGMVTSFMPWPRTILRSSWLSPQPFSCIIETVFADHRLILPVAPSRVERMGIEPTSDALQVLLAPLEHASPFFTSSSGETRTHNPCGRLILSQLRIPFRHGAIRKGEGTVGFGLRSHDSLSVVT